MLLEKTNYDIVPAGEPISKSGDVKRLTGNNIPSIYRIKISKYRILFSMNEEEIQILKVDSRGDIYK